MTTSIFNLKVQQQGRHCTFELSWGQGRRLCRTLKLPQTLMSCYTIWQKAYLRHYDTLEKDSGSLRGQAVGGGSVAIPVDTHAQLVKAQEALLLEFHNWLRQAELYDIRTEITKASRLPETSSPQVVDVFLTCTPIELERLPWEMWEISADSATTGRIRIARVPADIRAEPVSQSSYRQHRRPRVLVILGNDGRQDFKRDLEKLIDSLSHMVTIVPVYLQSDKSVEVLRKEIIQAITDPKGWEVLFFAGHSNETNLTGGELSIAPHASIQIKEIEPQLITAQQNGLQFALFNSCKGINIAESLINLGLGQVAVMREEVHNRVADEFLVQFLQGLTDQKDVHEALIQACHYLKTEKQYTYPSASLIPSLYRHPKAGLFRIRPTLRQQLFPKAYETVMFIFLLLLSLPLPVQDWLIGQRMLWQAKFRNATSQDTTGVFPVLMVQIDPLSIEKAEIKAPYPMDRQYLARLVSHLSDLGASVIGVDYLLDQPQLEGDRVMAEALQAAANQGIQFVFAAYQSEVGNQWLEAPSTIANPAWSYPGDIHFYGTGVSEVYYVPLQSEPDVPQPFSYQLASLYQQHLRQLGNQQTNHNSVSIASPFNPSWITHLAWAIGQTWLHPVVDFSLPPERIFESIPAWQLLESDSDAPELRNLHEQVVIIVPGGYREAGIEPGADNLHLPDATRYWRSLQNPPDLRDELTGSELHAYLFEHFLSHRFVIPIPDTWMVIVAVVAGKLTAVLVQPRLRHSRSGLLLLLGGTIFYAISSIELYILSVAVLLPIVLPTIMFWTCVLPVIYRKP